MDASSGHIHMATPNGRIIWLHQMVHLMDASCGCIRCYIQRTHHRAASDRYIKLLHLADTCGGHIRWIHANDISAGYILQLHLAATSCGFIVGMIIEDHENGHRKFTKIVSTHT